MARKLAMQDKVAIIGAGRTDYGFDLHGRSVLSLGMEAARHAILDAGLTREDIDGICGTTWMEFEDLQDGLGIPTATWTANVASYYHHVHQVIYASAAVFSGICDVALAVWAERPRAGSSAANNPFKNTAHRNWQGDYDITRPRTGLEFEALWVHEAHATDALANRYLADYGAPRDVFGMLAINNRQNASTNPRALMRAPYTMDDYLSAPIVRAPFGLPDLDLTVDFGNAAVITTVERAKALGLDDRMVLIHSGSAGAVGHGTTYFEQVISDDNLATAIASEEIWTQTDLTPEDMDIFYPFDGTSYLSTLWCESAGFCGKGEAYDLFRSSWDAREHRLKLHGRIPVNPHGGNLSEGRSQGGGSLHDACLHLRGQAEDRQILKATQALVTVGGPFHDAAALLLRRD